MCEDLKFTTNSNLTITSFGPTRGLFRAQSIQRRDLKGKEGSKGKKSVCRYYLLFIYRFQAPFSANTCPIHVRQCEMREKGVRKDQWSAYYKGNIFLLQPDPCITLQTTISTPVPVDSTSRRATQSNLSSPGHERSNQRHASLGIDGISTSRTAKSKLWKIYFLNLLQWRRMCFGSIFRSGGIGWNWPKIFNHFVFLNHCQKYCIVLFKDVGPEIAIRVGSFTNCCAFKCTTTLRLTRNMEWNGKVQSLGFIQLLVWSWGWGAKGKVF
jgi:hypothetical protein